MIQSGVNFVGQTLALGYFLAHRSLVRYVPEEAPCAGAIPQGMQEGTETRSTALPPTSGVCLPLNMTVFSGDNLCVQPHISEILQRPQPYPSGNVFSGVLPSCSPQPSPLPTLPSLSGYLPEVCSWAIHHAHKPRAACHQPREFSLVWFDTNLFSAGEMGGYATYASQEVA